MIAFTVENAARLTALQRTAQHKGYFLEQSGTQKLLLWDSADGNANDGYHRVFDTIEEADAHLSWCLPQDEDEEAVQAG